MPQPSEDAIACRQVIAQHSKSFALASRLLPADRRDDAVALYAWCRACDDAVDRCPPAEQPAALNALVAEIDDIYDGNPQTDIVRRAFQEVALRRRIPRLYAQELVAGMRMDVEGHRYRTVDDVLLYAYRVAGVVGLMMCHVLGVRRDESLVHATHLGIAMQLTNICRDVAEDWQLGRLYLPHEWLGPAADGLLDSDRRCKQGADFAAFRGDLQSCTRRLLALADDYYRSGDKGLADLDWRTAWAIRTARHVYSRIGHRVARQKYDPLAGRAYVSKADKLRLVGWSILCQGADSPRRFISRRWQPRVPEQVLTWRNCPPPSC